MKKLILAIILSVIITALAILTLFEFSAQKEQLQADHIELIDSKILGEERKLLVHLPVNYAMNPQKRYPVLYALDATSHDKDILHASTVLNLAGHLQDMIIIGLVNRDRNRDLTPEYIMQEENPDDLGEGDRFLKFIEDEAMPVIDKKYRTTSYNMLSGHSRAGLFVLYSLIQDPTLFDAYFCYSPAFWRGEHIISKKLETSKMNSAYNSFIYLSIGEKENDKMKAGFEKVVDILAPSDSTKNNINVDRIEQANHGTNTFYSIPKALSTWNKNTN